MEPTKSNGTQGYLAPESTKTERPWCETVEQSLATVYARAAWRWIMIWAGAGYPIRLGDEKIVVQNGNGWKAKFPDGPHLIEALRDDIAAVLRHEKSACLFDPTTQHTLRVSHYIPYLKDCLASIRRRIRYHVHVAEVFEKGTLRTPTDSIKAKEVRDRIPVLELQLVQYEKTLRLVSKELPPCSPQ
jgi:hypothetical protein